MPKIEMQLDHELNQDEALERIKQFIPQLKIQQADKISDVEENWSGNKGNFKFKAMGFKVSGNLTVENNKIDIVGDIPFLALPFKQQIEETISKQAKQLLEK